MGLDMYLHAKQYASQYFNPEMAAELRGVAEKAGLPFKADSGVTITTTAAYWRKANQIHGWFVTNCADGVDECDPCPVSREQLKELRDLCVELLKDKDVAKATATLAPRSGFFFGSVDIDEWYWCDLEDTVQQISPLLDAPGDIDFEYRASW